MSPQSPPLPNVPLGNFAYDKEGILVTAAADGTTDGPAVVTTVPAVDDGTPEGSGLRVLVSADGNSAKVFADKDIVGGSITFTAPADDSMTNDIIETVSRTGEFSFSHSKAQSMNLSGSSIPREEPPTP